MTGQLIAVFVTSILVLTLLGFIFYNRLDRRMDLIARNNIQNYASAAADYYYENLKSENIRNGISIFNTFGSYVPVAPQPEEPEGGE